MLKNEIGESTLRLKAAKFGHTIEEILPQYENTFYLPDKDKFRASTTNNLAGQRLKRHSVFTSNKNQNQELVSDYTPLSSV
jgi:hypothetical protein